MNGYIDNDEVPIFLINGFLDAGKTSFISYTMSEEYFHIDGTTVLISGEEGEVEYDKRLLKREDTIKIQVESKDQLSLDFFKELDNAYRPERILIEYNGMWGDPGDLVFPEKWVLYQQLTIMDGSTLGMYLANMKALMGPMLKNSELCIVNRCDNIPMDKLLDYKRKLRPMLLKGSAVVMEDKYGEIELEVLDEDLPYDVSADIISIPDDAYGIWFIDAKDYPGRYLHKKLEFTAQILRPKNLKDNEFVLVRIVMTCCEQDMQPLGYIAHFKGISEFKDGEWVKAIAEFKEAERPEYGGSGPYLEIKKLVRTAPVEAVSGF